MVDLIVDDPLFHVLELFGFLDYEFVVLFSYKKFFYFRVCLLVWFIREVLLVYMGLHGLCVCGV